jgi:hypothetical protein
MGEIERIKRWVLTDKWGIGSEGSSIDDASVLI